MAGRAGPAESAAVAGKQPESYGRRFRVRLGWVLGPLVRPRHPWARVSRLRYVGTLTRKMVLEVTGALAPQKAPVASHGTSPSSTLMRVMFPQRSRC